MELPNHFVTYVRTLATRLASEGFSPSDAADIAAHELISDNTRLALLNDSVRGFSTHWLAEWEEPGPWPEDHIVIGENGAGNYYCISRSGLYAGVLEYDHEYREFVPRADSLEGYYQEVMSIMDSRRATAGAPKQRA